MTLRALDEWTSTEAFSEYLSRHSEPEVREVLDRTRRYLRGDASKIQRRKVESFISRMKAVNAGDRVNGSGPSAVSDRTAALRNWGYDPTGRFA